MGPLTSNAEWRKIPVKWRLSAVLFAISIISAVNVVAQRNELSGAQKNELSGVLGRTFVSNQGITGSTGLGNLLRFGNGLSFEINYARRVMTTDIFSLSAEIPLVVNPDEDLHAPAPNQIPQQYSSFMAAPSARLNLFPAVAVSPWISFGGGFAHYGESSTLLFGGKNTGSTGTNTGVLQGGLGLDVKLVRSFSLRGEVRDFWAGVPHLDVNTGKSRQHNYFVGAGLLWRF
jgi:hypothetical protein